MKKSEIKTDRFSSVIKEITVKMENSEMEDSYKIIIDTLRENPDAPEPQNLLGLWNEMNKNFDLARKHYRAAYALDPTYRPASVNLERVCTMLSGRSIPLNFGNTKTVEPKVSLLDQV
jgi:Flp pilus assembly protein TadD